MPIAALNLFIHNLLKLINIKYHLANNTFIETSIAFFTVILFILFIFNITYLTVLNVIIIAFCIHLLQLLVNIFIKGKKLNTLIYKDIFKTCIYTVLISLLCYFFNEIFIKYNSAFFSIIKITLFFVLNYFICWNFRHKILNI